jgi:hypothetical protein
MGASDMGIFPNSPMETNLIPSPATNFIQPIFVRYSGYATSFTMEELLRFF